MLDRRATPAPDRVERAFQPTAVSAPDRLWLADDTYVATQEGRRYLAVELDAFGHTVAAWARAE